MMLIERFDELDQVLDVDDRFVKKFRGFDELGSTTC